MEPNGDRNKSDCLYCCPDWSINFLISLDLHIMQLTDRFNIYRTHLHGTEGNKDKLQGIFDLHVSLFVSFSYDVSFFSGSIPQFSLTSIYIVMSDL